ncbi:MAG: hypothetical protein SFY69_07715 [Planctomycetota bacterium]|nr:hypothetical protein [Planctomycetota bacterium]
MNENVLTMVFDQVPGRVDAALRALEFFREIENPCAYCEATRHARDLTTREQATYNVALATLTRYLSGEVDMGGPAMNMRIEDAAPEPAAGASGPGPGPAGFVASIVGPRLPEFAGERPEGPG